MRCASQPFPARRRTVPRSVAARTCRGREQPLKREQPHVRIEQGRSTWFWGPRWPDLLPRAYKGKTVTVYDISADALDACREDHKTYAAIYQTDLRATEADTSAAQARLSYTTDLAAAVADADLVIEAVPEVPDIKTAVYTDMSSLLKPSAVIATNSPIPVRKEVNGYIVNAWFIALDNAARTLVTNGIGTPEDIDRSYLKSGATHGALRS
ncbi:3-hydroxyacyl-CoA dehydrogenase NAD-binding domain-containing protein [Streptomyces canus]|uniref:3-hydroxyacyl-CoA dehydrogenase NAD-binding domain-containing protein n=1 Tax=Streptomyces canus TaxID=58343 RepID=UPI0030E07F8C